MVELLPHVKHVRLRKEGSTRAIILIHRIPAGVPVRTHVHAETGRTDQPEKRRSGAVLKIHIGAGEKKNRQATNAGGGFLNFRMFLIPEQEPSKKLLNSREYTYLNYYRDCT